MASQKEAAKAFFADNYVFALGAQLLGWVEVYFPPAQLHAHCSAMIDSLFAGVILCQLTHWIPHAKNDTRVVQVVVALGATAALCTTV